MRTMTYLRRFFTPKLTGFTGNAKNIALMRLIDQDIARGKAHRKELLLGFEEDNLYRLTREDLDRMCADIWAQLPSGLRTPEWTNIFNLFFLHLHSFEGRPSVYLAADIRARLAIATSDDGEHSSVKSVVN